MRIEFTTSEYLKEHGKEPKGRGGWMFSFEGYEYTAQAGKTLTEAKKEVREYVKKIAPPGYTETVYVDVLP